MDKKEERIIKIKSIAADDIMEDLNIEADEKEEVQEVHSEENDENLKNKSIYELLENDIMNSNLSDAEKAKKLSHLIKIRDQKVNIMLVGSTGSGKSSTINAMFNMEVAKVGVGVDPETNKIDKFEMDNLIIWDTPGLGDSIDNDKRITREIVEKLSESDENNKPLIDLVIVIIDASTKDLGTSYNIINNVLIPCLGKNAEKRILIGLNQSDIAMKGNHWLTDKNEPDEILLDYLKKKADSIHERIKSATGLKIHPIFYCAGYKESDIEQRKPYNLIKLLNYIVEMIPREKRLALADNINKEEENWIYDDHEKDYRKSTQGGFFETVFDCLSEGAEAGSEIGRKILGIPGSIVGGMIGGAVGAIVGIFSSIID